MPLKTELSRLSGASEKTLKLPTGKDPTDSQSMTQTELILYLRHNVLVPLKTQLSRLSDASEKTYMENIGLSYTFKVTDLEIISSRPVWDIIIELLILSVQGV